MKTPIVLSCAVSLCLPLAVRAERADAFKQARVEYGDVHYDQVAQKTIATGHVIITRGTLVLDGDRAEVDEAPEGYRTFILRAAPGKVATFREKRDGGQDLWSEGRAERIEYDERTDVVKLFSRAMIRQLDGQRITHQMEDAYIAYDQRKEVLVGQNDSSGGGKPANGRGSMTFEPRRSLPAAPSPAAAPAAAAAPAPARAGD
jgi:lipopolysaccharide export system protein LptA